MLNLLKVIGFILSIFHAKVTLGSSQTFTSERILLSKNTRFRPLATKIFDQLIYVSFPSYPEPKIKLEWEKIGYEPCEIGFEVMYDTQYPINVDGLANGKMILSVLAETNFGHRYLLTLIINLEKCQFDSAKTPLNASFAANRDYQELIAIVAGEAGFDVFLTNHSNCSQDKACRLRYSEKGVLVNATDLDLPEDVNAWSINSVNEKDFSNGYFYTLFTSNGTTIRRLNQDLQVHIEESMEKSFLYSDTYGRVNYCRGISNYQLKCQYLDEELGFRMSAVIDTRIYKSYLRKVQMFNLPDESTLIFLVLQVSGETMISNFSTYLQRIDSYGKIGRPIKFHDDVCKDFGEVSIAKMRDHFFCINVSCRDAVRTKCVIFGN